MSTLLIKVGDLKQNESKWYTETIQNNFLNPTIQTK